MRCGGSVYARSSVRCVNVRGGGNNIIRTLRRTVLSKRVPTNARVARGRLTRDLNISQVPIQRTLVVLRCRNLVVHLPGGQVGTTSLARRALHRVLTLKTRLRQRTVHTLPRSTVLTNNRVLRRHALQAILSCPLRHGLLRDVRRACVTFTIDTHPTPIGSQLTHLLVLSHRNSPSIPST